MALDTLISDIQALLTSGGASLTHIPEFSEKLARRIGNRVEEERHSGTLRLSNIGTPCKRKLWYVINKGGESEPLGADSELKFLYGDILEETILWLAKEAGHSVEREQDEVSLHGVVGHIDAVIDGVLVDVKSASSLSFNKFSTGLSTEHDSFGYLVQLDAYLHSLRINNGAFLAIDKQLGKICLDFHTRSMVNYKDYIDGLREIIARPNPPERLYKDEAFGQSGNRKIPWQCGYCPFKRICWDGLKGYAYSSGPVFLSRVVREPDVSRIF